MPLPFRLLSDPGSPRPLRRQQHRRQGRVHALHRRRQREDRLAQQGLVGQLRLALAGQPSLDPEVVEQQVRRRLLARQDRAHSNGPRDRIGLAIMVQESKGCVRVPLTDNGVKNPGLFQSRNGKGFCDKVADCQQDATDLMFRDGLIGTHSAEFWETGRTSHLDA